LFRIGDQVHNAVIEVSSLTGMFGFAIAFILFGSVLSLLIGLEQLTGRKNPGRSNILLFIVSIFASIILYNCVLINFGIPMVYPWTIFFCMTSLFTIGPFNYLYFRSLLDQDMQFSSDLLPHLAVPAIALIAEVVFQTISHENKVRIIQGVFSADFSSPMVVMITAGIFLG
jgi:hypothetical protein